MWQLVIILLTVVPDIQTVTVLFTYDTYEECQVERNRVGFDMAASYPYELDFVVDCRPAPKQETRGHTLNHYRAHS